MRVSQEYFSGVSRALIEARRPREHLIVALGGEQSQYLRFSRAKVRQFGEITDMSLRITLITEAEDGLHKASRSFSLTGNDGQDRDRALSALVALRSEAAGIPADPFAWIPEPGVSSSFEEEAEAIEPSELVEQLLPDSRQELDLVGILAQGPITRAVSTSAGVEHWFEAPSYFCEYSLYPSAGALKASKRAVAGKSWDRNQFELDLEQAIQEADGLRKAPIRLDRGEYRAYLAPDAVADLAGMFSWQGIGETAIRLGESPLKHMRDGGRRLSPLFSLEECFEGGLAPRFTSNGELAPARLPLIEAGALRNTLVSPRCAREHGLEPNGANDVEGLRSPAVAGGTLSNEEVLGRLGTGVYLSNIHYLNWSDQQEGRITGMTRHACFWVENGKRVAPIESMRWDDSLFRVFGSELEALGRRRELIPDTRTYGQRNVGGILVPGALVKGFRLTL